MNMKSNTISELYCPLCENQTHARMEAGGRLYHHCHFCDLVFMDSNGHLSPQKERERYLLHDNDIQNSDYVRYLSGVAESIVVPFVPAGSVVLDFGSGPETVFAAVLEQKGYKVLCYDPCFAPDTGVLNRQYDAVVAVEVIEHIAEVRDAIMRISGLIGTGGIFSVKTLFHDGDMGTFHKWWYREDPTHVSFFSPRTMQWIAVICGLTILHNDCKSAVVFQKGERR